jgi:hypothetical protein
MNVDDPADQIALRDLVARYAHHADRKQPTEQSEVFTVDGRVRLYEGDPDATEPVDVVTGRAALARTFAELIARYDVTTYLNGQSLITVDGDAATGETYCLAMHVLDEGAGRELLTMSIRYLDVFARTPDGWLIADRRLVFDWVDRRPSHA